LEALLHKGLRARIITMTRPSSAPQKPSAAAAVPKLGLRGGEGMQQLDRLIHERLRLGIVSALAVNASLTFTDLRRMLSTTDGNLSVHARRLEDAGYIRCTKSFDGRLPRTAYKLTGAGRKALSRYLDHMQALIQSMRG
jgi:DNA-binding MarR family transcriptional regulator